MSNWAQAQVGTTRLKRFKIGTVVRIGVRRNLLQFNSGTIKRPEPVLVAALHHYSNSFSGAVVGLTARILQIGKTREGYPATSSSVQAGASPGPGVE